MVVNKLPKISALTGFSLSGWLLPLCLNLPLPLEGFSLALSCFSSIALAVETRKETIVSGIKQIEKKLSLERVAYQLALSHEKELAELRSLYGFGDSDNDDDDYQPGEPPQAQIEGATLDQRTIAGGPGSGETDRLFRLEWLLQSNSQHALLCGDTGAGKTVLARWLLDQLAIKDVTVLDPDDDQKTWSGFTTIGTDDDWESIREAYGSALEEFNSRKPNDRSLTPRGYVLEELPDHLIECRATAEKVISRILRRGRKRKVFLLGITQDANEHALKLSAPLKKCFTTFFLQAYAQHALKHLVPKADRAALAQGLKECKRPAIVQFKGEFYFWDVPDLSGPGGGSGGGNAPAIPLEQEQGTIATLNRLVDTVPTANELHWQIVDLSLASRGEWLSVRDLMRRCPSLKTAEDTRKLISDLIGLELGETRTDGQRLFFKAFRHDNL